MTLNTIYIVQQLDIFELNCLCMFVLVSPLWCQIYVHITSTVFSYITIYMMVAWQVQITTLKARLFTIFKIVCLFPNSIKVQNYLIPVCYIFDNEIQTTPFMIVSFTCIILSFTFLRCIICYTNDLRGCTQCQNHESCPCMTMKVIPLIQKIQKKLKIKKLKKIVQTPNHMCMPKRSCR